jgi:propanol-preferring alcohol dehydrogenase
VRVPDDVDPLDAAPLTCAGVTTYKAVKISGASSAGLVAVFGAGGLGHLAIQYARVTGAAVVAIDINEERLKTARELGAEHTVHAGEEDPIAAIQALGGADQAISTAVSPSAFEQALGSLARGGTLVCVGLPAHNEMRLPIFQTVLGGLTVKGSIVGTHHDLEEVFELHRRGRTQVERVERELEDVNDAIAQVLDGSAPAPRMVFRLAEVPSASTRGQSVPATV